MIWYSCGTYSKVYIFADNAKFFWHILTLDDSKHLQNALEVLQKWSKKLLLKLNTKKYKVVSFWRYIYKSNICSVCDDNNHLIPLERGHKVVNMSVCFDKKLSFREHIHATIIKAYMMWGIIKHNFKYLTVLTFVLIYNSTIRSNLELLDYFSSVWALHKQGDIEKYRKETTKISP